METLDFVAVGHIMKETIRFPEKEIGPVLGSPAAYSAVAGRLLGGRTGIVSVVGRDMPSSLLRPLRQAHVDLRGVAFRDCPTRTTILTYDKAGNKEVTYEKVASDISPEYVPDEYFGASAFFVCPMDFEVPQSTVEALRRTTSSLLMTDLGGYGGSVSTCHLGEAIEDMTRSVARIAASFDIVKASGEDCRHIFLGSISADAALSRLLEWGPHIAILTLGQDGSLVGTRRGRSRIPPFATTVVDTTGAGDVYAAAFLVEYLRTKEPFRSALYASAASSVVIEGTGGVDVSRMPTDEKVRGRLAEMSSGRHTSRNNDSPRNIL
jgi:sugar/nucleoside kinase (ribokinase family)